MSKQHTSVRSYGVLIDATRSRSFVPPILATPALWWLPGGGIDFGEAPEDTLIREFREETGLEVQHPVLLGVTSDVRRRDNGDKIHTVRILFTVELAGGELHHEVHGTTDHAAWFELRDLESMNIAEYAQAAIAAAQGK